MTKTLILTPNNTEMCGMYQLAKDLAKEFDGEIRTKSDKDYFWDDIGLVTDEEEYKQVISLLYPMHLYAKRIKKYHKIKWICYDQKIPPITKLYFPNFWRRQYMKVFTWLNNRSMIGADEYWDVTEREQKPRWTEKIDLTPVIIKKYGSMGINLLDYYAINTGRTTDYKNFDKLKALMENLKIPLVHPENEPDWIIHALLSKAKLFVSMSLWEGFGRGVMEMEALGKSAVAYDVGAHKKHIKKGVCVPLNINNMKKSEELFEKAVLEVWNR